MIHQIPLLPRLGQEMEVVEALQEKDCDCFLVLLVALVSPGRPPYGWCWKRGRMERENVGGKTTAEGFWFFDVILWSYWHFMAQCSELNSQVHPVTQFEMVPICPSPTIVSADSGAGKEARRRRLWPPSCSRTLHRQLRLANLSIRMYHLKAMRFLENLKQVLWIVDPGMIRARSV